MHAEMEAVLELHEAALGLARAVDPAVAELVAGVMPAVDPQRIPPGEWSGGRQEALGICLRLLSYVYPDAARLGAPVVDLGRLDRCIRYLSAELAPPRELRDRLSLN
ncbi:MAG TPA: hypothetical protein VM434_11080 [Beijerinckiaceae bacterium]|nr:hypothetical protein [Beijerinckiaceae bacterium]